nr:retinol dehydrogenase 13 isoform X3 [Desmodus rotundus]
MLLWSLVSTHVWGPGSVLLILVFLLRLSVRLWYKSHLWDLQQCSTDLTGKTAVVTGATSGLPKKLTPEGLDLTFATNYVGPFLLTNLLQGPRVPFVADDLVPAGERTKSNAKLRVWALQRAGSARVINVSSFMHTYGYIDEEHLTGAGRPLTFNQNYYCSKLLLTSFTGELARRLQGKGVTVNSVHPGVVYTKIMNQFHWSFRFLFWLSSFFLKEPQQGANPVLYLSLAKELDGISGKYFSSSCVITPPSKAAQDPHVAQSLWNASVKLTHLDKTE